MKKIKIIAGITWALAGLMLIIILFPGLDLLSASASRLPFMKINPNYTGGEVAKQLISDGCTLDIRRPVFDGLVGERKNGYVQLDWRGTLKELLYDSIDYNHDGISDFLVQIDRKNNKSELYPFSQLVTKIELSTPTSYGWAVRIGIKK